MRHSPTVQGRVEGPLQVLLGESFTINGTAVMTGDLYLPGTPSVIATGAGQYLGIVPGTGSSVPDSYSLTVGGNASLQHINTRSNPPTLVSIAPPPAPPGTRDVVLSAAGEDAGDFATLRNLTLNANVGAVNVPPGTYGIFTARSQSRFKLGVSGSTEPTIYNFQQIVLNSGSSIEVVGPVIIVVAQAVEVTSQSRIGILSQPHWITLRIALGGLTVRAQGEVFGHVRAPDGLVTIEGRGRVRGSVYSDNLIVQGRGTLEGLPPLTGNQPPVPFAGPDQNIATGAVATLNGTATDDGQPNPPAAVSFSWSKFSGPGNVTFGNSTAGNTTTTFSADGVYLLRLTVSDGEFQAYDDVQITVATGNAPPSVNAGADAVILAGAAANLQGTASDDGQPNPPATLTTTWSKFSGPGDVVIANASALLTSATFSQPGVYVLRLSATDSVLTANDDVTIVVNSAPQVSAGPDLTIQLPNMAALAGSVTDDGLPTPAALAISWSKVSGPGIVTFGNSALASTTAQFSSAGVYVLRLTASDGHTSQSDDVEVTAIVQNQPPSVNAGPGQTLAYPAAATLNGTITDDGLPNPPAATTAAWSKFSGPGDATFADATSAATTVTFSVPGVYVLRLTASDSALSAFSDVTIVSNARPTVNAGADQIITLPTNVANLTGTAADDGLPNPPGAITTEWIKVGGPGTVTFGNATALATTATFAAPGVYTLRLSAGDSHATATDDAIVVVNETPVVSAAANQTITLPDLANVMATATDDGLPNPPGALAYSWSKASGPGDVTFSNANALSTTAAFSVGGVYVLRFTADDSASSAGSEVTITVNTAPLVIAGANQVVTLPVNVATLAGSATDDGLPNPPGALSSTWTKISGPGNATFADASSPATTATFDAPGVYVLKLSASDSLATSSATVSVTINQAPVVNAGANQTIELPNTASLAGTVTDDGLPNPPAAVTTTWTKVSGPGTVTFGDASALNTAATFSQDGTYVLRLTASDSAATVFSDVTIVVKPANSAPVVNAGPDQSLTLPAIANLTGTANDDGFPNPPAAISVLWSKVGGPGNVTFANTAAAVTTATFSASGVYTLRLSANDDALTSSDDVVIVANAAPVVSAGNNQTIRLPQTASLTATATDDGLPNPPGALTYAWSKVSGPGTVTFSAANALSTTATFSVAGNYVLRFAADDSLATSTSDVAVTVLPANLPPVADAGAAQTIRLPNGAILTGSATDDGIPDPPATLTYTWSKVSGPGTVTFSTTGTSTKGAEFSAPGTYVLRLTVSDSDLSAFSDVTITVLQANQPPVVSAGAEKTVALPASIPLDGIIVDDGQPGQTALTSTWTKVSGPGTATFNDASSPAARATVSQAGTYVFRLSANDTEFTAASDVTIRVLAATNQPPVVSAGTNQAILFPNSVNLSGAVTDDALPAPTNVTVNWTKVSGPGNVTFQNATAAITTATFSAHGSYVLKLSASDGELSSSAVVTITVNQDVSNGAPAVNAGIDQVITMPQMSASLAGTVTDDGKPAEQTLTVLWTKVSGPGTVFFTHESNVATNVAFSKGGTYVLRLAASDGEFESSDEVVITVTGQNQPPSVNAGADRTVSRSASIDLAGVVNDDGLPADSVLAVAWSKVSGPGDVSFTAASSSATSVQFSADGTYVLRLTANDGQFTSTDDVAVSVHLSNTPPAVDAGIDKQTFVPVLTPQPPQGSNVFDMPLILGISPGSNIFYNDICYHAPSDTMLVARRHIDGAGEVWQLKPDGSTQRFCNLQFSIGLFGEMYMDCAPDEGNGLSRGGFVAGEVVSYNIASGGLVKISADGSTVQAPWVALPPVSNWIEVRVLFDRIGVFNGDLLAAAGDGKVWRINKDGTKTLLTTLPFPAESSVILPNDVNRYGPFAGKLVIGGATGGPKLYAIDPNGTTVVHTLPSTDTGFEGLRLATGGLHVYGISNGIRVAPASALAQYAGDILINNATISRLYWDGTSFQMQPLYTPPPGTGFEELAFSPMGVFSGGTLGSLPPINSISLSGAVRDDDGDTVSAQWTATGPGPVHFENSTAPKTKAWFNVPGTYTLRLTASDGHETTFDETVVSAIENKSPVVTTFADSTTVRLPRQAVLHSVVSDDNLPSGTLKYTWSVLAQPAGNSKVTFGPNEPNTTAFMSLPGTYVLRLTVSDGELSSVSDLTFTVLSPNAPPIVSLPLNHSTTQALPVTLTSTYSDDGLPNGTLKFAWSLTNGPGLVTFANPNSASTTAGFSAPGTYQLVLAVSDGELTTATTTFVSVSAVTNQPPSCNAGNGVSLTYPNNVLNLVGLATDDGLPAGSKLGVTWSLQSGPAGGTVSFGNAQSLATTATFSTPNDSTPYVLKLSVTDGVFTAVSTISVLYANNVAPVITLTANSNVVLSQALQLQATVTDDGMPNPPGTVTTEWSRVSGPGTVTFADRFAQSTSATFSAAGFYHLRLTASDSLLTSTKDWFVNVFNAANQAPSANAGPDQVITSTLPAFATLTGTYSDDHFNGGQVSFNWALLSGPGTVTFANSAQSTTTAQFSARGTYVLRFLVSDGSLSNTDTVSITIDGINSAPVVSAGAQQNIVPPATSATLIGKCTDDGLPVGSIPVYTWTKTSGPGTVTFASPSSLSTTATFGASGLYVLRLTAFDGEYTSFSETVVCLNGIPTVNAGPDRTVTIPAKLALLGSAHDDGLPLNATLTTTWTVYSGFGTVVFDDPLSASTQATFSQAGTYILRLTASDSQVTRMDEVTVTVFNNVKPLVNAGPDQIINFGTVAALSGSASDSDARPAALQSRWTKLNGPGMVGFGNVLNPATSASFSLPGIYTLRLTATDTQEIVFDDVTISVREPVNQPPIANAGSDQTITLPSVASLVTSFSDDGLPSGVVTVRWEKLSGPTGVTFTQVDSVDYARFTQPGTYTLRLTVTDTLLTAVDTVVITVLPQNMPPIVNAGADQNIAINKAFSTSGTVSDDGLPSVNSLSVLWSKLSGPGDVTFVNAAAAATAVSFSREGTYVLKLSSTDSVLSASDTVTVVVGPNAENKAPVVNAGPDIAIREPETTATLTGIVADDGLPFAGALSLTWTKVSGPGTVTFANAASAATTVTLSTPGKYVLRLSASDSEFSASDDIVVRLFTPADANVPVVQITSPSDGAELTKPTNIAGNVSFTGSGDWTLEYALNADEDNTAALNFTPIASGSGPVANAALGQFDTTLLLNGSYVLRLTATDESGDIASDSISVVVERNMKVGNFSLAFNDCSVNVSGIPIQVTRTYDSRDKRNGDFGVGWRVGIADVRLEKTGNLGRGWQQSGDFSGFLQKYTLQATKSHKVTITFPDGKVYKFEGRPQMMQQSVAPVGPTNFIYVPIAPTVGSLTAVGRNDVYVFGAPDEQNPVVTATIHNYNGTLYNPKVFQLTTAEGMVLVIEQGKGLRSLTDLNGNTLTVSSSGLVHSSGKSVVFSRDAEGRITRITDPSGHAMTYNYDDAGNLSTFTDRENNTTSFTYNNVHGLLSIKDPRGITPIRNEYDD
ncbi:MAG TPA: DUF6531 domain-containing protein, partial [Planctomycetota bacterium]|nr:DUF6531 domain-containing protein [Planctomycetota bacterium]